MAAGTNKMNGTLFLLDADGKRVAHLTNQTLNTSRDTFEQTTKDSTNNMKEFDYGEGEWSVDVEFRYNSKEGNPNPNFRKFYDALRNENKITITFHAPTVDSALLYKGDVLVQDVTLDTPEADSVTVSATLQGDGDPTSVKEVGS